MRRAMSTLIYARRERLHPGLLDQMVSGGAEAIEIFAARGHFNYTDRQHIRQIANWFRSTGVTFHSMHSPMHPDEDWGRGGATHINIASVEKLQRVAATDEIKRAIEVAEQAPFQYLVQHVGIGHEERAGRVGAHFGVVLVRDVFDQVEVATFRSDHDYEDGRHPEFVRFETDPREDVLRRDFTINGLMLDPDSGAVLDFVDGRAVLARGVVPTIGDPYARFREDHLRLLRGIRFAARFGFEIDSATFDAILRDHALILKVAMERVREELVRILTEGGARRGFELLDSSGMLLDLLPEVAAMKGVAQPPEFHPEGDVWRHTLLLLEHLHQPTPTLALGALLHDVGKPPTFRVAGRIRFDGHVEEGV